jgi:uncharacterized membrane protein
MLVNLKRRVPVWCEKGLISPDTGDRILAFEAARGGHNWIGFGIAGIGVTAVVTGIISLVAANWEDLSDVTKLVGYFLLQCTFGGLFLRTQAVEGVWREAILTVFALSFLAGIGLVGQLYQLSGSWWGPLALWCGLTLPATLHAHSRLLPSLWSITAIAAPLLWIDEANLPGGGATMLFGLLAIAMVLTACSFLAQLSGNFREEFRAALIVFGLGSLLVVATPWVNALWSEGSYGYAESVPRGVLVTAWGATAVAVLASLARVTESRNGGKVTALLLLVVATYVTIPHLVNTRSVFPGALGDLVGAVGFLLVWVLAATSAALASRPRLFDIATVVIAIRFIVIYFEVFGSLTITGVGLIVSGAVIIGVGVLWNRSRKTIKLMVEERI